MEKKNPKQRRGITSGTSGRTKGRRAALRSVVDLRQAPGRKRRDQDAEDLALAKKARGEAGGIDWKDLKKKLGL